MPPRSARGVIAAMTAVFLAAAGPAAAQTDTVRAGAPGFDRFELPIGTDSTDTYAVREGQRRRLVVYVETVSALPGGYLIVGANVRPDGSTVTLDSVVVADGSLRPRRHSDLTPAGRMSVVYADGRVTGQLVDTAGAATPVDAPVADGAFDYSMAHLVVNRLPLQAGYSAVLLTHDVKRGPIPIGIRVLGEEMVTVHGIATKSWRVEVDYGTFRSERWIDQETRRDLRTTVSANGMDLVAEPR